MASLTLKNIPDDLLERLRERAAGNRRSLTGEILTLLERAVRPPVEAEQLVDEVRERWQRYGLAVGAPEEVDRWKRSGREGEENLPAALVRRAFDDGLRLGARAALAREIAQYAEAAKGSADDLDRDLESAALEAWPEDGDAKP